MVRGLLEKRRGSLPPIIVALITMAAIVSAALITWFMFVSTRNATNRPILEVTDAYYVSGSIFLTISNIGAVDVENPTFLGTCSPSGAQLTSCSVVAGNLNKGGSAVVRCATSAAPRDGDMCTLALQATNQQTSQTIALTLSFRVVTP